MPADADSPQDPSNVAALSRKLQEVDQQLQALTAGEVDAVISPTGESYLLQKAQVQLLRSDRELRRLAEQLDKERSQLLTAQAVAKLGSWSYQIGAGSFEWSNETYRIFGSKPGDFQPTISHVLALIHPEDRDRAESAFFTPISQGLSGSTEHRLVLPGNIVKVVQQRWKVYGAQGAVPASAVGTCQDITRRKRSEQALLQSQSRLRMVSRLGRIGAWSIDPRKDEIFWSDEVCALHEVDAGTRPTLEQALEYCVPEWRESMRRSCGTCIEHGRPFDFELQIITARGRRLWVRIIGEAVRNGAGTIRLIQGAMQDISDRKEAELEARRVATRLTNTLESFTVAFFTVDPEWRYSYVNAEAERMFGRRRAELIGQSMWEQLPQLAGTDFEGAFREAIAGNRATVTEGRFGPGQPWYLARAYPSEEGLAVYMRDISLERAEHRKLKLLEASVARLNDMVVITDARQLDHPGPQIEFVNEAFMRRTGYTRHELVGATPRLLQGALTGRAELDRIRAHLARSEPVRAEVLNYSKSGEAYWIELDIVPVASEGREYSHFVAVQRDVTERKRDQEALRELNQELESRVHARTAELNVARVEAEQAARAKSTFLATMSHEIRTPMNGVIGLLDVLSQTKLQGAQREVVSLIRDSANSLLKIIDDILDFSKIEAGKMRIEPGQLRLADTVEKVCGLLDSVATGANVRLALFIDPRLPDILTGDELRLRQVLVNLVGNAIKFSSGRAQRGEVRVRAELTGIQDDAVGVEFSIADNGIGMDQNTLNNLFTPFSQADASTTRHFGGTGLGLAISSMLVRLMGGSISVQSELSKGSTFTLGLRFERSAVENPVRSHDGLINALPVRIVGEDESLAQDLSRYLSHEGATVTMSTNLANAASTASPRGISVWVLLPDEARPDWAALRTLCAKPGSDTRFVILGYGEQRRGRVEDFDRVYLDVDGLARRALVAAVAVAAGRLGNEVSPLSEAPPALPDNPDDPSGREATGTLTLTQHCSSPSAMVLVAEDNEMNQEVIVRQLQLLGFSAEIAVNGRQALARWRTRRFAILLTDVRMPELDGYALTRMIRSEEGAGSHIPIIALTANALPEEEDLCRAAGMDDYLAKPVRLPQLSAMMSKWIQAPTADKLAAPASGSAALPPLPVDLNVLISVVGDDPTDIEAVLNTFRATSQRSCREIAAAAAGGSAPAAVNPAHKLKSGAFSIGAQRLGRLCAQLEEASIAGRVAVLTELAARIEHELTAVLACLDSR